MHNSWDKKWGTKILAATVVLICALTFWDIRPQLSDAGFEKLLWKTYYQDLVDEQYADAGYEDRSPGWDKVFEKDTTETGQNLYLLAYQEIKKGPADAALENTAVYFGYSEDAMLEIIDGELYKIWQFDPSTAEYNVDHDLETLSGINAKYNAITSYYNEQLLLEALSAKLSSSSKAQEMFANGDTSDSGFDLIVDLQIIEVILFGTSNTDGYGSNGGRMGDNDSEGIFDDAVAAAISSLIEDEEESYSTSSEAVSTEEESNGETDSSTIESDEFEPDECFEDSELAGALANVVGSKDYEIDTESGRSSDSTDEDYEGDNNESSTYDGDDNDGNGVSSDLVGLTAADWSRDIPCNDFFCLSVNFVTEDDEPTYEETNNCIDCHFTYMVEIMRDLSEHGYIPNKVTGNMMEESTCKEASAKLAPSFSVFLLTSPILTPPNDDVIVNTTKLGESFLDAFKPGRDDEYDPDDPLNELTIEDLNAMRLTNIKSYDDVNLITASELVLEYTYEEIEENISRLAEFEVSAQMSDMTTMYQSLESEITTMNDIFENISILLGKTEETLKEISEKTDI